VIAVGESIAKRLRSVIAGDLRGWRGLPADLTLSQLTVAFPRDSDWSGTAQLGRRHRPADYLWVDIPTPDGKLRVWCEGDRVVELDVAVSGVQMPADHVARALDEDPVALDTWQATLPMLESELVFPAHGLAVFVDRELESIWHLALFPPVALDAYLDELRIDLHTRRHPQSRI
jgi:hypothetical protein